MESITVPDATRKLLRAAEPFLRYLVAWEAGLESLPLTAVISEVGGPECAALYAVDVTAGMCNTGPLASPRVDAIVPPIVDLFRRAHDLGISKYLLPQDAHPVDSPEFQSYGPHCIVGTEEAETVPELRALPFANHFVNIPKRSLSPAIATELESWLAAHPEVTRHIVVGDCTDLCVYQTAMHLKLRANALGIDCQVLVPEDCVQTYDMPVETAEKAGTLPHDGDLLHLIFLYHMALNGIRVAKSIV